MKPKISEDQDLDIILVKAKYTIDKFGNKIYDLNSIIKNFTEETQNLLWKNASKNESDRIRN